MRPLNEISKLSLFLPLAFFIAAVLQDMHLISNSITPIQISYIREIFVIVALILSLPLIYRQRWASDRNVLRGLRSLLLLILLTDILLLYSAGRLEQMQSGGGRDQVLYHNFANYVFVLSWVFFATVFILIVLGTLRNLIYIKQRRSTARNFTWLMVFLLLTPLLSLPFFSDFFALNLFEGELNGFYLLSLFLMINLMVVNAFRVSWINYLNKKQKLACFWGGLLLVPIQIHFNLNFHNLNPLSAFSPVLGRFLDYSILFLTIYLCIAFLTLLAHLPTAQLTDRKIRQINSLHHLSHAVSSEFDRDRLVRTIVRLAAEVTEADFSWLVLRDEQLALASSMNLSVHERANYPLSQRDGVITMLENQREPLLDNQISKSQHAVNFRAWKNDLNSLIAVPLVTSNKVVGFLFAGKRLEFGFEGDDAHMLRAFSDQAAVAIENARLIEESIVKERLEQELKIAHDAQMKLLPKEMPRHAGLQFEAVCITANEVGGDYYDFFHLGKNRFGVVIGDVSGKGPSAAFYMAEVKGIMEALAKAESSPKEVLIAANRILYPNLDRRTFISLVYGVIDVRAKRFTFCRAGHCPLLFAEREVTVLEPRGLGVGLDGGELFSSFLKQSEIKMSPGSALLLYTDGATEARNRDGAEYGEQRLVSVFSDCKQLSASEIKQRIIHDIYTFIDGGSAHDDLTFIVIKAV